MVSYGVFEEDPDGVGEILEPRVSQFLEIKELQGFSLMVDVAE